MVQVAVLRCFGCCGLWRRVGGVGGVAGAKDSGAAIALSADVSAVTVHRRWLCLVRMCGRATMSSGSVVPVVFLLTMSAIAELRRHVCVVGGHRRWRWWL